MKKILGLASLIMASLSLAACSPKGDTLFVMTYNGADPNMANLWYPGFRDNAKDYGFTLNWQDANNKIEESQKWFDIAKNDSSTLGFAVNVVDQKNVKPFIDGAKSVNKPIVLWNREAAKNDGTVDTDLMKSYDKAWYVGIESAEGGRYQGKMMAEYILKNGGISKFDANNDGKIGIMVVRGEDSHADAEARSTWAPYYLDAYLTHGDFANDAEADTYVSENYKVNDTQFAPKSWTSDGSGDASKSQFKSIAFKSTSIFTAVNSGGTTWDGETAATKAQALLAGGDGNFFDVILSNNDGMAVQIANTSAFKQSSKALISGIDALPEALQASHDQPTRYVGSIRNDGKAQAKVVLDAMKNLIGTKGEDGKYTGQVDLTTVKTLGGLTVVTTKEAWNADPKSVWYDANTKAFRVHHAILTSDSDEIKNYGK